MGTSDSARMGCAATPPPPYYLVVFASQRAASTDDGYAVMAQRMEALARTQPGFLGIESARGEDGFGITVSYWQTEADIARWKENAEHAEAQRRGNREWYTEFALKIARVERAYTGPRGPRGTE